MKETTFSKIKKGQFFYFPKGKTEFVFNGGGQNVAIHTSVSLETKEEPKQIGKF